MYMNNIGSRLESWIRFSPNGKKECYRSQVWRKWERNGVQIGAESSANRALLGDGGAESWPINRGASHFNSGAMMPLTRGRGFFKSRAIL